MRIGLLIVATAGALALAAPAAAQGTGCRISLTAAPDTATFTSAGRNAARAPALAQATGTAFAAAAAHLCASGGVRAADFSAYRRLLVRNAEGANEPTIYDDAEEQAGALIIEFAFTDGGAPAQAAIETALRCWKNPEAEGCSAEDMGP